MTRTNATKIKNRTAMAKSSRIGHDVDVGDFDPPTGHLSPSLPRC